MLTHNSTRGMTRHDVHVALVAGVLLEQFGPDDYVGRNVTHHRDFRYLVCLEINDKKCQHLRLDENRCHGFLPIDHAERRAVGGGFPLSNRDMS